MIVANPNVKADEGRIALKRGPVVYRTPVTPLPVLQVQVRQKLRDARRVRPIPGEPAETILHGVARPARQKLHDLRPLVPKTALAHQKQGILLWGPVIPFQLWVKLVHPPLTTLLPSPSWQCLCNEGPVGCAKLLYVLGEDLILLLAPLHLVRGSPWTILFGRIRGRLS